MSFASYEKISKLAAGPVLKGDSTYFTHLSVVTCLGQYNCVLCQTSCVSF